MRGTLLTVALAAVLAASAAPAAPAADPPLRIWPLGDSITYGTIWRHGQAAPALPPAVGRVAPVYDDTDRTRLVWDGGYRAPLHLLLSQSGLPHEYVGTSTGNPGAILDATGQTRHDGHPGWFLGDVSAALDGPSVRCCGDGGYWMTGAPWRPAPIAPDVVVLHLGTNDVSQGVDPIGGYPNGNAPLGTAADRQPFADHLGTRLQALVDKIQALRPGVRIVLSTVLPIAELSADDKGKALTIHLYNERIRAVARAEAGQGVVLADVWSLFAAYVPATAATPEAVVVRPGTMAPDGHHPLPPTYEAMAVAYRLALAEAIPNA